MLAFTKTGIWPLNHHILEPSVFEPLRNTTTEPLQPLPARLLTLLVPTRIPYGDADPNVPTTKNEAHYIIPLPPVLPHIATRQDLHHFRIHSPTYSGWNSSGITDSVRNFWTLGVIFFGVSITVRG